MSRTRLIRPAFFTDERMASLSVQARLVYIGLWTLCDDAGYFERRPPEIAAELFRFQTPKRRQRVVDDALAGLLDAGRIRWLDCGEHGVVPTLPEHGVMRGGNHSYNVKAKHDEICALTLFRARQAPMTNEYVPVTNEAASAPPKHEYVRRTNKSLSDSGLVSDSGLGLGSDSGRAAARDSEPTEFRSRVPRPGAVPA